MGLFSGKEKLEIVTVGAIPVGYKSIGVVIGTAHDGAHVLGFKSKDLSSLTNKAIEDLKNNAIQNNAIGIANIKLTSFAVTPQSAGPELGVTAIADMLVKA